MYAEVPFSPALFNSNIKVNEIRQMWNTPKGGGDWCYANQMQVKNYLWWMIQTDHSK